MITTKTHRVRRALALTVALGLTAAACGGDDDGDDAEPAGEPADDAAEEPADEPSDEAADEPADEPAAEPADEPAGDDMEAVTIDWWHIQNTEPSQGNWQAVADQFMEEHPNVQIDITVMENEAFKAAIQTNMQAGDVPDLFQSWGGGGLLQQVDAGLVQDISGDVGDVTGELTGVGSFEFDGALYGLPWKVGMVGFWYNADLFEQAGLDAPADTWDGLLEQIQTLKDAGITPIAVGAGDQWPAHFWYSYLMVRLCGSEGMVDIARDNDFTRECVVEAGQKILDLVALEPFQEGYLGAGWDAPDGESGTMANEQAAMDLMGQWAPGAFAAQLGLEDASEIPWTVGWAPFPEVSGGAGVPTEGFGGVDGFVVGKDAPPEAVEFLKYIVSADVQRQISPDQPLPANRSASDVVTDPNQQAVFAGLSDSTFLQQYLDQFFTPEVGAQVNEQTAMLFADATSPDDAAAAITATAGG
ncbi:MAG: extracellular solute-binding protein [Ilumatobacter fluminis]|uniref:extracellular solute-binding protein n=1 Tax=Ilumatobacter fluminis TaxID=467091 RepID=UPI0032ED3C1B